MEGVSVSNDSVVNGFVGIKDLREIIFRPETGDSVIIDFAKLIGFNIRERLKLKNIDFHYTPGNNEGINCLDRSLRFEVEKLLQEIISNVLKHAEAAAVNMEISINNNNLMINLKDDGIGFDYNKDKEAGFGINGIISRINRLNGEVDIESSNGNGVHFKISIPVGVYE